MSLGGGHKTRRCRRVTYPESYITKYTTHIKINGSDPFSDTLWMPLRQEYSSKVVKNTYDATYDETFEFEVNPQHLRLIDLCIPQL